MKMAMTNSKIPNLKSQIPNSKSQIPNPKSQIPNPKSKISNLKSKISMSSHHIVRDDQEPALIIANGASCNEELLGQLLEWSPLVIVLDSAMERVLDLGIKVDVLLGDFDRDFDPNYYKEKQYPLEIVHTPDQNKTDLEKAFDYLIEKLWRDAKLTEIGEGASEIQRLVISKALLK